MCHKKAAVPQWYHVCSLNCFNSTFLCRSQSPGWENSQREGGHGHGGSTQTGWDTLQMHPFSHQIHFSCPRGMTFLSPVPCTNELFLLHFLTVSLPFLSLPAWLQFSFTCLRRPRNGHFQELLHPCNMLKF